jgi:hypothetical protein
MKPLKIAIAMVVTLVGISSVEARHRHHNDANGLWDFNLRRSETFGQVC